MSPTYPLHVLDERSLPADYAGPLFVWDIDRTYLATRFSSVRHLARIPLEFAVDKHAIAGMPEVLKGLRRGAGAAYAVAPIYFVTASPPLLTRVITRKMLLDGVEYDGITFKDWAGVLRGLRPGRLKEQLGFKLCALLTGRLARPGAHEVLFGDDVEKDAVAYSIYARVVSGALAGGDLVDALRSEGVKRDDRHCILALTDALRNLPARGDADGPGAPLGSVRRAFIFLDRGTAPERFTSLGEVVAPVRNAYQLAISLEAGGFVDALTAPRVMEGMRRSRRFYDADPTQAYDDAFQRGLLAWPEPPRPA